MSDDQEKLFRLAFRKSNDADSGDEEENAEDLEREVVLGEKRVANEVDIGTLAGREVGGDFAIGGEIGGGGGE